MTKKITLDIGGMHCASCSTLIAKKLEKTEGIRYSNVNLTTEKATVEFDDKTTNEKEIIKNIESLGYKASLFNKNSDSFFCKNFFYFVEF